MRPIASWVAPLLLGLTLIVGPIRAQADEATKGVLQRATWSSYIAYRMRVSPHYETLALIAFLNRAYEANSKLDETALRTLLDSAREDYRSRFSLLKGTPEGPFLQIDAQSQAIFDALVGHVDLLPGASQLLKVSIQSAYELAKYESTEYFKGIGPQDLDRRLGTLERDRALGLLAAMDSELSRASELGTRDAVFSRLVTEITQEFAPGVSLKSTPEEILIASPQFADHARIAELLTVAEKNGASIEEIRRLAQEEFAALNVEIATIRSELHEAEARRSAAEKQEREARLLQLEHNLRLEGHRASLYILGALASVTGHGQVGKSIQAYGHAAYRIGSALNQFRAVTQTPGISASAAGMGGAVLAGNVIAATSELLAVLSGQPSADELILHGINGLREELRAFRGEMEERLRAIDDRLVTVYDHTLDQLNELKLEVFDVHRETIRIRSLLAETERKLQGIETNLTDLMNVGSKRQLFEAIERCLRPRSSIGPDVDTREEKICSATFSSFATEHALDPLSSDSMARRYESMMPGDADPELATVRYLAEQLSDRSGLERKVNLLAQAAEVVLNDSSLAPRSRKANPIDWAFAAETYLRFLEERGPDGKWISPEALRKTLEVGEELEVFFARISRPVTAGTQPKFEESIIGKALANYRKSLEQAKTSLREATTQFEFERLAGYSLWDFPLRERKPAPLPPRIARCADFRWLDAGLEDQIGARARDFFLMGRGGPQRDIPLPETLSDALPEVMRKAAHWKLAYLHACVSGMGYTEVRRCDRDGQQRLCGKLTLRIVTGLGGQDLAQFEMTSTEVKVAEWGPMFSQAPGFERDFQRWSERGEIFRAATRELPSGNPVHAVNLAEWTGRVAAFIESQRERLARELTLSASENRTGFGKASAQVSVAANLLRSYISLGLPISLERNDRLRALLFGSDPILDGAALAREIRRNPYSIVEMGSKTSKEISRVDALERELRGILGKQSDPERHPWIDTGLRKLRLMQQQYQIERPKVPFEEVIQWVKTLIEPLMRRNSVAVTE